MLVDPNLGKKSQEQADIDTYCDITGFTRSNGDKPTTENICRALNEKLVSFENVSKNINMDGYTITNLGQPQPAAQSCLATRRYAMNHILVNSIDPEALQPGLIALAIDSSGNGFTTITPNEINNQVGILIL